MEKWRERDSRSSQIIKQNQGKGKMKNIKTLIVSTILLLVGAVTQAAPTTNIETFSIPITSGYNGGTPVACSLTAYYGWAKMTNSSGTPVIIPPAGTTLGTFTDISGYPSPYFSSVIATRRSDGHPWCDQTSVTFPATNSISYVLTDFIQVPYPTIATNMTITLQIVWQ